MNIPESQGSITRLYDQMRQGDDHAATELWLKFAEQLSARAKRRLESRKSRGVVDADDAVVDVFDTLFRRARQGNFPRIDSREDLLRILLSITDRKCSLLNRHFAAQKRGGAANILHRQALDDSGPQDVLNTVEDAMIHRPDTVAAVAETFDHLMKLLDDHDQKLRLAEIAELRLAGWSNEEIAERIGRSVKVIERRFALIRELWDEWDPR